MTFFITPFHYTDCFSVRQIGYGGTGNYFYILIDRANEDKETAVHFLNQVDEADLMALMEDGQSAEKPPVVCN